ncbi:iron ABC transporter permease [Halobacteriales archaeon QS_4_69_34]|nr:MAG: iron ABC transporter permease [Halobacteriales archaeon QS_4_69_34]
MSEPTPTPATGEHPTGSTDRPDAGAGADGSRSETGIGPRIEERSRSDSARSLGLTLLSGAIAVLVVAPLGWLVVTALGVGPGESFSLLSRPRTVGVLLNSAVMVVAVTGLSVAVAVPLAFLTARTDLPFRRFFTVAVSLPLVIPSYVGAFAFVSAFGPRGEFQALLAPLGIDSVPAIYGLPGVVGVLTLYTYPYVFLSTRASLLTMDARLPEAARTLGGSRAEAFRRVTAPAIRPAVAAGALLVALYTLSDFGTPAIMRYDVFTRVIYVELTTFGGRDLAALLSLQLVVVTLLLLAVESRVRTAAAGRSGSAGAGGARSNRIALGRWRWPAVALPAGVSALALVVPVGVLGLWLLRGATGSGGASGIAGTLTDLAPAALNSVAVAAAAALAAALLALPVAVRAAASDSRLPRLFERLTYVGYGVPGVVLGLALVFLGARYLGGFYQTLPLLVFAYVVRFLPQSVGSSRAALGGIDVRLPEAARTLGRSGTGAFRAVTLPLIAPGVLAGAALVFLTTMKELPATLLLRPTGFETLVTTLWRAESAGYYGRAAIPALALVAVSGLSLALVLSREGR